MKILLSFLIAVNSLSVYSQTKVKGRIFDGDSQQSISGVVVYSGEYKNITMSDEQGNYQLEVSADDTVYFSHLAYESISSGADSLIENPDIYLMPHIVELSEVTVFPIQAESFLKKSFENLLKKYQKDSAVNYLLHIESNTSLGDVRELYAMLNVSRTHNNYKRDIYLNTYLTLLDIVKSTNDSAFYIKNIPIYTEFFPSDFDVSMNFKNYHYELYDDNDVDKIIIKETPRKPDRKKYRYSLFAINRSDTVLVEYTGQSFSNSQDLTADKIKGVPYMILSHYSYLKFKQAKDSEAYYIEKCQNISNRKTGSNPSYTIFSKTTTVFELDNTNHLQPESKKIKPYDYLLFRNNFPQTPGFWKQYIK
jgi:hypothetical protein